MKKHKYFNLIIMSVLLFLSYPSFSQSGDEEIKAPDSLNRKAIISHKASKAVLLSVTRAGSRLVAAGERGVILTSDDHGSSWKQATVPTSVNLTALKFIDESQGWAVGHMGVILHTQDGGKTWTKQLDGIQAAEIAVKSVEGSDDKRAIKEAGFLVSDGPDKPFFDIDMQANGDGIAIGAFNLAFVTHDFGKRWEYLSPNISNKLNKHLYQVRKVQQGYLIFGEKGLVLLSNDHGQHFEELKSPYEGTWFGMLVAKDGAWIAYGLKGNVFISRDQGKSWSNVQTGTAASISAATQLSDGTIVLASQAGELLAGLSNSNQFKVVKHLPGFPVTSIDEAVSGDLIITGLRGVIKQNTSDIKTQLAN